MKMAELSNCDRDHAAQSLDYLLYVPLPKELPTAAVEDEISLLFELGRPGDLLRPMKCEQLLDPFQVEALRTSSRFVPCFLFL